MLPSGADGSSENVSSMALSTSSPDERTPLFPQRHLFADDGMPPAGQPRPASGSSAARAWLFLLSSCVPAMLETTLCNVQIGYIKVFQQCGLI
jgi:hypothetical protein